ncbi:putative lyase beta subunit [Anaeramoeba ignava]|uniref:Lyase beta subunit n=1 Tax=Anaeramoeba ignava TaxID=1746090 RepID=A0A9Q0LIX5_ANAIG|nr:putative lyase beta subunit [Anaeramoeba ignava]
MIGNKLINTTFKISAKINLPIIARTLKIHEQFPDYINSLSKNLPPRTLLYVPGDSKKKLQKSTQFKCDLIAFDLEDAVIPEQRSIARKNVLEIVSKKSDIKFENPNQLIIRFNEVQKKEGKKDIEAFLRPEILSQNQFSGILLPKVENFEDIFLIEKKIKECKKKLKIYATFETAKGIVNIKEILESNGARHEMLRGLVFGAEDYSASIGCKRTPSGNELLFARSSIVLHAAAYGLESIDMVNIHFKDDSKLISESLDAVNLGFTGKSIIHPKQIQIVQNIFSPSKSEIDNAIELLRKFEANNKGVLDFHGISADVPVVKAAIRVLLRAQIDISKV